MKISKRCMDQINFLCQKINNTEWSGVLFFSTKGNIKNLSSFVVTAECILLKDIGTTTYTSYHFDSDMSSFQMKHQETFEMSLGKIHSHHNMSVFHSGIDMSDLWQNTETNNLYLSLIVNNHGSKEVKIGWRQEVEYEQPIYIKNENGKSIKLKNYEKNKSLIFVEADGIFINGNTEIKVEDWFKEQYEKVKIEKQKSTFEIASSNVGGYKAGSYMGGYKPVTPLFNNSYTDEDKVEDFLKELLKCEDLEMEFYEMNEMENDQFISIYSKLIDSTRYNEIFNKFFPNKNMEKNYTRKIQNTIGQFKNEYPERVRQLLNMIVRTDIYGIA